MSLQKSRLRIYSKGLGKTEVREAEPTSATEFSNIGHLKSTAITDDPGMVDVTDETGALVQSLSQTRKVSVEQQLLQTSYDEWLLVTGAVSKIHSIRYCGLTSGGTFQYFVYPAARIVPGVSLNYQVGERLLPFRFTALVDSSLGYDVPPYMMIEAAAEIRSEHLQLYVDPRYDWNAATTRILDMSGFQRHGVIGPTADVATIWGQADILRFDGSDDNLSFGTVCDLDADDDFLIEIWVRIPAADGTAQEILSKKSASGTSAGFSIVRNTDNHIVAELADGTDHPEVTGGTDITQNVWKHVALVADRTGNAQLYMNGAADGSAVDISSVGDMTNVLSLTVAKLSTGYGQIDTGALRIYNFGASGLPSDIATIVARHYSAEKTTYGL